MNLQFIKDREGLRLKAYKDTKGIWTIGYGTIIYENGIKVKQGDVITKERAEALLVTDIPGRIKAVKLLIKIPLNENQITALVSLCYNIGTSQKGFAGSTLLRRINGKASESDIRDAFYMWNKITIIKDGIEQKVEDKGLTNRRHLEADLYFS